MQKVGVVKMSGMELIADATKAGLGVLVGTFLGWMIRTLQMERRLQKFKIESIDPLQTQILQIKQDGEQKMEKAMGSLRSDMKEWEKEVKDMFREINQKLENIRNKP
jgi:hypothetical protein